MATRKTRKAKKTNKRFRKTRSKRQRGGADDCVICQDEINIDDSITTTECTHTFHKDCLRDWCHRNQANTTCPLCREPISNTCTDLSSTNILPRAATATSGASGEDILRRYDEEDAERAAQRAATGIPIAAWGSPSGAEGVRALFDAVDEAAGTERRTEESGAERLRRLFDESDARERETRRRRGGGKSKKKTRSKRQRGGSEDEDEELIKASKNGHVETVKMLLDNRANIEAKDNGANIEAKDNNGATALILASIYGHKETVEELLKKIANIDAKDYAGRTALVWACQNSYNNPDKDIINERLDIVQKLLTYGADMNQEVSPWGKTILQRAKDNRHTEVVKILEQHIKFKELLGSLIDDKNNETVFKIPSLSKLSLDSLNSLPEEERELFTQFAARNSWNIDYKTGKIEPYYGGKRKTRKNKRKTRKNKRKTKKSKKSKIKRR